MISTKSTKKILFSGLWSLVSGKRGQSLFEILIALTVGIVLIAGSVTIIIPALRANTNADRVQVSSALGKELLENARAFAEADWHNISNLATSSANKYFLVTVRSPFIAVTGTEGIAADGLTATSSLVGYWKFDESTGTAAYDFSGNGNNATLNCSGGGCYLPLSTTGIAGGALNFQATTTYYAYLTVPSSVPTSSQVTVTTWYKWNGDTGDDRIINRGWCSSMGWLMHRYYGFGVNNSTGCSAQYFASFGTLTQSQWYFLAGVFDGSVVYTYKNGVLNATSSSSGVTLGSNNYSLDMMTQDNGLLDDVRIYNRALSASEINRIYKSGVYTRYFYVDNVGRSGSDVLQSSGGSDDPSTKKITVVYGWLGGPTSSFSTYLSRFANRAFIQTDWSGGPGQNGPATTTNSKFSTSTGINYSTTTGSIMIEFE